MKLFICVLALAATAMSKESNIDLLRASNEVFTANMFQEVVKSNPGKNVVLSAFSVLSPLAQLSLASVGETHDEILKAIGLPNDNVTKEVFTDMIKELRSVKRAEVKLANKVYVRDGEELNDQFAAISRDVFNSDVENINFEKKIEAAAKINAWVEDNTNHKIKDLLDPQSLDADTKAVLVNAIYFKSKWWKTFEDFMNTDMDFYVSKNKTIKKDTMHMTDGFQYGESKELDAKLLELPFEAEKSSLLIVLPNEVDGINALVEKLKDPSLLTKAVDSMFFGIVNVDLPKFKIESITDLLDVLKKMHVDKIFTPGQARLDNLLKGNSDLYISQAVQKTFIDINEEGAEAAAANAIKPVADSLSEWIGKQYYFSVNRPFYFELKIYNLVAFNGIVYN